MRREDVADIFLRLPDFEHPRVHVVMRAGPNVSIDTVIRLEPHYAVIRGREAGNQDEGRVFFVPYEEMVCMKMERVVKAHELEEWYSDTAGVSRRGDSAPKASGVDPTEDPVVQDPSSIARQNLLERIRAARSVVKK
jgi:hypothetical protein